MERHVSELTGVQIDKACKDVARLCFVSHDPDAYHNPNAVELLPLPEKEKAKAPLSVNSVVSDINARQRIATELLGGIRWESETRGHCTCPGKHLHTTGDAERDCKIDLDGAPTVHCFHDHCRGILDAINREMRSRVGKAEHQVKPRAAKVEVRSGETAGDGSELTSLTSLGGVDFPAPLEEAAFRGLAGDFVKRFLPHTEADAAALLFQFLVGFGNVIDRHAYMIADGAFHHCNINVVLVGQTSKGRKGSAWWHVLRLLKAVDEHWADECIASGLSSGEGLIWAVRDPITKTVPQKEKGKFTGEHVTIVADAGVSDKRLMVVETEFSTVLKVMSREGNTLSPVIRNAWDGAHVLRTLTKNSPARATDAHISIIGHITREELRQGLTQTESANGFGNRILWVAVKRSKCLPEGGEIVAIADLVLRAQKAVECAKTIGELKRDDAAREAWAREYAKLSNGKPGLVGAIIARAEAQVLRLSELYALLDCSKLVSVEHLNAALACWRDSERSAKWTFETGTGDKNADKILAALTVAAEKGLTKLEITCNVFNRHATRFEIDEALRLLHRLGLASRKQEETRGRPAERWFLKPRPCEVSEESETTSPDTSLNSLSSPAPAPEKHDAAPRDAESGPPRYSPIIGDELGVGRL